MKTFFKYLLTVTIISLNSCKSLITNPNKPLYKESLILNDKYEIQDFGAVIHKIKIVELTDQNIIGVSKKGDRVSIVKKDIREIKKVKVGSSIIVAVLAILSVIFIPI